jgi:nitric oxide dioxygenase
VRRPYTLTSAGSEPEHYEILVKREPRGVFSRWLFESASEDSLLRISPPQGDYYWRPDGAPAVCLVAGIGVTPALAMLRSRQREGWSEALHIDVSARREQDLVCLEELRAADPGVSMTCRVTGTEGRIRRSDVEALCARFPGAAYFLCGPVGYMDAVRAMLLASGVDAGRIHVERFETARRSAAPAASSESAPRRERGWMGLVRTLLRRM